MEYQTPVGTLTLPTSTRAGRQVRYFATAYDNNRAALVVTVRWDDECRNGHNHFSVTGDLYRTPYNAMNKVTWIEGKSGEPKPVGMRLESCGCLHEEIAAQFPELAPLIKYHLMSPKGPLHYFENTVFLAGDRDCWGYRADEQRRDKAGLPMWQVPYAKSRELGFSSTIVALAEKPCEEATPWLQDGKPRELTLARSAACWPEATDAELCADPADLKQKLHVRLPSLLAEFQVEVQKLGFVY